MVQDTTDYEILYINRADQMRNPETGELTPDFKAMYELYQRCFQLKEEQLSSDEFIDLVAKNTDGANAEEAWVGLKDKTGKMIAASNYDAFKGTGTEGVNGTSHLIFTMVDPAHRQKGTFKALTEASLQKVKEFTGNQGANIITFAEQNNPYLMTAEQYIADNEAAGIDQCARRHVFEQVGYRTLNMRYIQPPTESGDANTYLDLVVQGADPKKPVPTGLIREHLNRFFELSFPEGTSVDHPEVAAMKRDLKAMETSGVAVAEVGKFNKSRDPKTGKIAGVFDVEALRGYEHQDQILGITHAFKQAAIKHFGAKNMEKYGLPSPSARAARAK